MSYSASVAGMAPLPVHWYRPPQSPDWQWPRPARKTPPVRPQNRRFQCAGTLMVRVCPGRSVQPARRRPRPQRAGPRHAGTALPAAVPPVAEQAVSSATASPVTATSAAIRSERLFFRPAAMGPVLLAQGVLGHASAARLALGDAPAQRR